MARHVKLCAVAPRDFVVDRNIPKSQAVDEMIAIWEKELTIPLGEKPDLILLPEVCDLPENFWMEERPDYYAARGEKIYEYFCEVARKHNVNIGYSARWDAPDGRAYNCTRFINREGETAGTYIKNFLVVNRDRPTTSKIYASNEAKPIQLDFGTVGGVICFDLNFNELREAYKANPPDVLAFSSMFHGGFMQQFWAYDVRAYFLGSVPADRGGCSIIAPSGEVLEQSNTVMRWPFVCRTVNLDCITIHLTNNMSRVLEAQRKYGNKIKVIDPGRTGACTVCCEAEDMTIEDIVKEFDLQRLDDFLDSSRNARMRQFQEDR